MEQNWSHLNTLRLLLAVSLCVIAIVGKPMSHSNWEGLELPSHQISSQQLQYLLQTLGTADSSADVKFSNNDHDGETFKNLFPEKRGFGIVGLDNVDMITSTLDRVRNISRQRQSQSPPAMSPGLSIHELRELMRKAG